METGATLKRRILNLGRATLLLTYLALLFNISSASRRSISSSMSDIFVLLMPWSPFQKASVLKSEGTIDVSMSDRPRDAIVRAGAGKRAFWARGIESLASTRA